MKLVWRRPKEGLWELIRETRAILLAWCSFKTIFSNFARYSLVWVKKTGLVLGKKMATTGDSFVVNAYGDNSDGFARETMTGAL